MNHNDKNISTPCPVLLNCWKHHAGFIKGGIQVKSEHEILGELKTIGDSLMDLYLGSMSPHDISVQVIEQLKGRNILEKKAYTDWIETDNDQYRMIELSDNSKWTLRLGDDEKRYVHIHPGRYSHHTMRVRSLSLKTAIAVLVWTKIHGGDALNISVINKVRKEWLNESPIKSVSKNEGLGKLIGILKE
ncbi:MAG: hypothetical protein A2V66_06820 [Ignavibacteria bacterium RBG_13_36_8]|nr:MAG: hypothetical protein A2V66_06820 [Ignavibacteria bacterium RBG_13_36_8]